jgi:NTP pyrophosphatase (non-canonical NTP hydrolase)
MTFEEYQVESRKTAIYPNKDNNFLYPILGLAGETGEVAEKVKKLIRDRDNNISQEFKDSLAGELGDVLWYISQIASELGLTLDDIAEHNIEKLYSRMERGKLSGSGDER